MELSFHGAPHIPSSQADVWRHLMDPRTVALSVPGMQTVDQLEDGRFRIHASLGLGMIRIDLVFDGAIYDAQEPDAVKLRMQASSKEIEVIIASEVSLVPLAAQEVELAWTAHATVSGALAKLGEPMLRGAVGLFTERFWSDFALRAGGGAPPG